MRDLLCLSTLSAVLVVAGQGLVDWGGVVGCLGMGVGGDRVVGGAVRSLGGRRSAEALDRSDAAGHKDAIERSLVVVGGGLGGSDDAARAQLRRSLAAESSEGEKVGVLLYCRGAGRVRWVCDALEVLAEGRMRGQPRATEACLAFVSEYATGLRAFGLRGDALDLLHLALSKGVFSARDAMVARFLIEKLSNT